MKILIIDDDPQTLDALTVAFRLQWQDAEVITARDGERGLEEFFDNLPDVVLLDVKLPGKNGYEVLREIRRVSDVPMIMLTARSEETDQVRGLEMGADDYVVKPCGHMALMARIKAVMRRAELPPPLRAAPDFVAGQLTVNFQNGSVSVGDQAVHLTPHEYRLLTQFVRNPGRLMTHEALIRRVWGDGSDAGTEHLKVFVSRLRAKLERGVGSRYIETERGIGYRFVMPRQ